MELSSKFVGAALRAYEADITWRRTMNYAAAVGDMNPRYVDDELEGGIVAPPMFAVAATWPISERMWEYIEADDFPREVLATQVHYTEHLRFYRPIRPGDTLSITGRIAAVVPHRAGTLVVVRYDAVDRRGEPVFCEHMGGLMRGIECSDEGAGAENLPVASTFPDGASPMRQAEIYVPPEAPFVYDGCTGIFFPIHTSTAFAHSVGLPGVILQGTASLALCVREIMNGEAAGDPEALEATACRFTGMVFPGSTVTVRVMGVRPDNEGVDIFFDMVDERGTPAISDGYARLKS